MHQITTIYFHERDEHGRLIPRYVEVEESDSGDVWGLRRTWRDAGLSDAEITIKWNEYLTEQTFREGLEKEGVTEADYRERLAAYRLGVLRKRQAGLRR